MSKLIHHKDCVPFFIIAICFFLCIQGCGGNDTSSQSAGRVGSASFSIQWPNNVSMKQTGIQRDASPITSIDCTSLGVATVSAKITDSSGTTTLATGSWSCSAHTGTVDSIQEGSGYQVIVTAEEADGTVLYQGTKTGITITAGQNTDIGTVALSQVQVPYIEAYTQGGFGDSSQFSEVGVFTDSTEKTPIETATVTINGTSLNWNSPYGLYNNQSLVIAAGDTVNLSVTLQGKTYTAQAPQFTTFPSVTSPTSGATWTAANANTITITCGAGVPVSGIACGVAIWENEDTGEYSLSGYFSGYYDTSTNTASVIVPANTLSAGSAELVIVMQQDPTPIAGAAVGSSIWISWCTTINITAQ